MYEGGFAVNYFNVPAELFSVIFTSKIKVILL